MRSIMHYVKQRHGFLWTSTIVQYFYYKNHSHTIYSYIQYYFSSGNLLVKGSWMVLSTECLKIFMSKVTRTCIIHMLICNMHFDSLHCLHGFEVFGILKRIPGGISVSDKQLPQVRTVTYHQFLNSLLRYICMGVSLQTIRYTSISVVQVAWLSSF